MGNDLPPKLSLEEVAQEAIKAGIHNPVVKSKLHPKDKTPFVGVAGEVDNIATHSLADVLLDGSEPIDSGQSATVVAFRTGAVVNITKKE